MKVDVTPSERRVARRDGVLPISHSDRGLGSRRRRTVLNLPVRGNRLHASGWSPSKGPSVLERLLRKFSDPALPHSGLVYNGRAVADAKGRVPESGDRGNRKSGMLRRCDWRGAMSTVPVTGNTLEKGDLTAEIT